MYLCLTGMLFPLSWRLSCGDGHCFSSLSGSISIIVLRVANSGTAMSEQGLMMGLSTDVTVLRTNPWWIGPLHVSPWQDQHTLSQRHILGTPSLLLPCTCHKQILTVFTIAQHTTFWEVGQCCLRGSMASHFKAHCLCYFSLPLPCRVQQKSNILNFLSRRPEVA